MPFVQQVSFRTDMWRDPEWLALPSGAQWLYMVVAADGHTNAAGVAPLLPRQWARCAPDMTGDQAREALNALEAGGRAVVNYDMEELILHRLLIDRGAATQPNVVRGAIKAVRGATRPLREAFASTIAELEEVNPNLGVATGISRSSRRAIPPAVRLAVYERDLWRCQDCGRRIPAMTAEERKGLLAPSDDKGWLELDHIHPWSDNPDDSEENLRALCSKCNRIKGARILVGITEPVDR